MTSRRLLLWAPVALLLAFEYYLSGRPVKLPPVFPQLDKVVHLGYFFLVGVLAVRAARFGEGWSRTRTVLTVTLAAALWGVTDEWHQSTVPGRSVEALDVAADVLGAFLAALVAERTWVMTGLEETLAGGQGFEPR